jgi:hypothetical protein
MIIPEFPEFIDIDLSCRDDVNSFLSLASLEASEYTFTNLFAFRFAYKFRISRLMDNLLILKTKEPTAFYCPVGSSMNKDVLQEIIDYQRQISGNACTSEMPCMERVPDSLVKKYSCSNPDLFFMEDRDQFDYIYNIRELIELKGRKFHDKRNHVNRFRKQYVYEYLHITHDLIDECLEFEEYWCEVRECGKYPGLERERCAILEMLNNFQYLGIRGGAIRMDGRIAAIALGEKILPDTLVVHVEKANPDIPGLYQIINQEFLMHNSEGCEYVNREQDLGVEGLRKAKMSYHPVRFVKKYKMIEKV